MGVHAVEAEALDEQARDFYQRYDFTPWADGPLHLFLPMETVERAFAEKEAG